jgi:hypothetical protein
MAEHRLAEVSKSEEWESPKYPRRKPALPHSFHACPTSRRTTAVSA